MKYLLILILLVVTVGCAPRTKTGNTPDAYTIIVFDGCEYVIGRQTGGHDGYGYMSHKGNCKYCIERNK